MGFNVNYNAGGTLDEVNEIKKIKNFAQFDQPYNKMIRKSIPAKEDNFIIEFETPDFPVEILSTVVSATGYGEKDYYDMYVNDKQWFYTWYLQEVKEGLYIGTSTYVKILPPKTKIQVDFYNKSGTSKTIFVGFRMLKEEDKEE